ncbi:MAG: DUF3179 domain-containing protein [Prolixibacteraceae bacterium]|jgi:hypothetical protein|nr:DUF3179 domain-containing protein [Prolixibacteraceae bacterium]MBT6006979.1 DUF3179 domain-containing protein [Prolixibacteraceae bacterium]MBT6765896.1 DUF3179 domain-containing protein [Prolixibacteraceae bacterium]MBT7000766.1 DUF3179 domain-containing protein [Prolixibacteraceae bacterium]MBT7394858.1 DUF3179 domain-containing protein [Prolixibacteraceae bacterium]
MKYSIFTLLIVLIISIKGFSQVQNFEKVSQEWKTDTAKHSLPLNEFRALLKRDGIPPIDNPKYISASDSKSQYFVHEPVIVIENKGDAKAIPLNILTYHEIVNDNIGDLFFSASYCPLCNSSIAFNRKLNFNDKDYLLDFGTSGMLRNSNLVMWDRQTETWWQQFVGVGMVGKLTGAELEMLPAQIISLENFIENYPNGEVLSNETGFEKQKQRYGTNVYEEYDSKPNPRLFFGEIDDRLPAMERVIDIQSKGEFKIYPHSIVAKEKVINDEFNGLELVLFFQSGTNSILDVKDISKAKDIGSITVFERVINEKKLTFKKDGNNFNDIETGSTWTITGKCIKGKLKGEKLTPIRYGNHFAFSWFAFNPESEIYK